MTSAAGSLTSCLVSKQSGNKEKRWEERGQLVDGEHRRLLDGCLLEQCSKIGVQLR